MNEGKLVAGAMNGVREAGRYLEDPPDCPLFKHVPLTSFLSKLFNDCSLLKMGTQMHLSVWSSVQ